MNKAMLAGAAMIAAAAVTAPAAIGWAQNPPQAPAGAQPGGEHGAAPGREMGHHGWGRWGRDMSPRQACVDRIARRAGFVAAMGVKLNLTQDQKPLWDKVVAATQTAQDNQRKLCDALPASASDADKVTVIDHLHHRQQMLQAQLQGLQQTEPAVQALYQSLTPEQKAIVDHPFHRD